MAFSFKVTQDDTTYEDTRKRDKNAGGASGGGKDSKSQDSKGGADNRAPGKARLKLLKLRYVNL